MRPLYGSSNNRHYPTNSDDDDEDDDYQYEEQGTLPTACEDEYSVSLGMLTSSNGATSDEQIEFFADATNNDSTSRHMSGHNLGHDGVNGDKTTAGLEDSDDSGDSTDFHGNDNNDEDDEDDDGTIRIRKQMVQEVLAKVENETRNVTTWRRIYFAVFGLSILCSTLLAYFATHHLIQQENYLNEISIEINLKERTNRGQSIGQILEKRFNETIYEMKQLSDYIASFLDEQQGSAAVSAGTSTTTQSSSSNDIHTWPYITLPAFASYASNMIQKSSSNYVSIIPFVEPDTIWGWKSYSIINQGWTKKALSHSNKSSSNDDDGDVKFISNEIYEFDNETNEMIIVTATTAEERQFPVAPIWQTYPLPSMKDANFNILSRPDLQGMYEAISDAKRRGNKNTPILGPLINGNEKYNNWLPSQSHLIGNRQLLASSQASSVVLLPVFSSQNKQSSTVVGLIAIELDWNKLMLDDLEIELPKDAITKVTLQNTCGQSKTFYLDGNESDNQNHDAGSVAMNEYLNTPQESSPYIIKLNSRGMTDNSTNVCTYSVIIHPTSSIDEIESNPKTTIAIILPIVIAITYVVILVAFLILDSHVQKKIDLIIDSAADSRRIISNLFPNTVRHRLFDTDGHGDNAMAPVHEQLASKNHGDKRRDLAGYLNGDNHSVDKSIDEIFDDDEDDDVAVVFKTKPIADLFPEVTIMFTDMVGFTAWSSVREPSQVFTLLESLYHAFDQIAKKRRVFKVETIGDCYVAVAGLPEPRSDHATVMCRFANDCLKKVHILTKKLVVVLGPDTESLTMRCGLHSGPVTAGVLRGERSRFQLFGDTMNTASRMESTGVKDKIQISQETADRLIAAGKVHWLTQREDKVIAKGKGEVETYWLHIDPPVTPMTDLTVPMSPLRADGTEERSLDLPFGGQSSLNSTDSLHYSPGSPPQLNHVAHINLRLVDWNVELLLRQLKLIAASRRKATFVRHPSFEEGLDKIITDTNGTDRTVLDEVCEVIRLPNFNAKCVKNLQKSDSIDLPDGVEDELRDYVMRIAQMYRKNPFHNFEHASHVTMSVSKLLSRIVEPSPEVVTYDDSPGTEKKKTASELHCYSYGITSDPLTQFACLFSALIHDVDHSGVPNTVIIEENPELAQKYKCKSIAEQNSVDQSWNLLLQDEYKKLRQAIYASQDELQRFRQLVVNSVMATDIMDKDLKQLRNSRWDKAFAEESKQKKEFKKDNFNRKATIVIEHLIQASDVAHTMQHWHIYRKWNERLFAEMLKAYRRGRSTYDPTTNWYEGELGFFDNYIIPLAKKLKDCGVFGVSSDEYLDYALHNRNEFAERGEAIIEEMLQKYKK